MTKIKTILTSPHLDHDTAVNIFAVFYYRELEYQMRIPPNLKVKFTKIDINRFDKDYDDRKYKSNMMHEITTEKFESIINTIGGETKDYFKYYYKENEDKTRYLFQNPSINEIGIAQFNAISAESEPEVVFDNSYAYDKDKSKKYY